MNAYYLQFVKQYQNRLNLTSKEYNKLDRKYNDINLMKKLQILYPKVSTGTAPANTGFWGTFVVNNEPSLGSNPRHMHVYLAYNDVPLTSSHQINSNQSHTFNVTEANRLPLPSSTLQFKVTFQSETQGIDIGAYDGFESTGNTNNPYDQENTLDLLVNENNYDNGQCSITIVISYEPR